MNDIINDTASEHEISRESQFDPYNGKLPRTNCNISMPPVKPPISNGDKICNTCCKEDVCMYKSELEQATKEIAQISDRVNVFIDTDIRCKKWSGHVSNMRNNISQVDKIKWIDAKIGDEYKSLIETKE